MPETQLPQVIIGTGSQTNVGILARETRDEIHRAFAMIHVNAEGAVELRSAFLELSSLLHIVRARGSASRRDSIMASQLNAIIHHVWTCLVLMLRLEREQARGHEDRSYWSQSSSVDIETFFVTLRSALDHVATFVVAASGCHGQAPDASFNELFHWLAHHPERHERFGRRLAEIVLRSTWFPQVKGDRDALVHEGAQPIVFGSPDDGVLFQVLPLSGLVGRIEADDIETRPNNLVEFSMMGARLLASLVVLTEDVAEQVRPGLGRVTYLRGAGLDVFRRWLVAYAAASKAGAEPTSTKESPPP